MQDRDLSQHSSLPLATLGLVALIVGTDFTGILLLVPTVEATFHIDITTAQWVVNSYALTFGMFMVAGGKLGDTFGRSALIRSGLVIFVLSSSLCALAPNVETLIIGRVLQGLGAALIWPNTIGAAATLVSEQRRSMAIGTVLASVTTGNVIGPLLSGVLIEFATWRYFFGINAALAFGCILLCTFLLPKSDSQAVRERVDVFGIAVLGLACLGLLYALDVGASWGWLSTNLLVLVGISVLLFGIFPLVEARVSNPMVSPRWLANRQFFIFLMLNGMAMPAVFTGFLYFPQYLAKVQGWTGLAVSFGIIPMMLTLAVFSFVSGILYPRFRPKTLLATGFLAILSGIIVFLYGHAPFGYPAVAGSMVLIALGGAMVVGPAGTATVNLVPEANAALASGLGFMVHLVIGAIGLAGATAVLYSTSLEDLTNRLATQHVPISREGVVTLNAAATDSPKIAQVLTTFDAATVSEIHSAMRTAFETGMTSAYWVGFAFAATGLLLALLVNDDTSSSSLHQ